MYLEVQYSYNLIELVKCYINISILEIGLLEEGLQLDHE